MPSSPATPEAAAPLHLQVPARLESVQAARLAVLRYLGEASLSARGCYRLELVLEEVLMNATRHAYAEGGRPVVDLRVMRLPDHVRLVFEDQGAPFDPTTAALPAPVSRLDDLVPGGRGLLLLQRQAQRLHYERVGSRNRLEVDIAVD